MRKSGADTPGVRCVLGVERLEDRTVPAGGVSVRVFDGILYIAGDDAANMISVTGVGDNTVSVRSLDGSTLINGQFAPGGVLVGGVKRGYHAVMNGGDDVLVFERTTGRGGLFIDMGDGNDTAQVLLGGHRGNTKILGGSGNDTVELRFGDYKNPLLIDTGAGDDQVNIFDIRGRASGTLANTGGTDFLNGRNFVFNPLRQIGVFLPGSQPLAATAPAAPADTAAPGVSLTSSTAAAIRTGTVDYTATFSEDVNGLSADGIAVTNGVLASITQVDARTFRFSVTPSGQGVVSAQVKAGASLDAAGNRNTASEVVSRVFDSVTQTPTLNLAAGSDSGTVGDLRTDVANATLTGLAEAGSTVRLFAATAGTAPGTGALVGTAIAGTNGQFFITVPLTVGPNSFVVQATDAVGNVSATFAQTITLNVAPTGAAQAITRAAGSGTTSIDLGATVFNDAERVVRLTASFPDPTTGATRTASIDVNLFADDAPQTVANFLAYVNSADPNQKYGADASQPNVTGAIFHRLARDFVLQGGGFKFNDATNTFVTLTKLAAVNNEPGVSNTIGTLAFAKTGNNPNSATNEFFFNLADNSANLDTQNGGFTVFGQVMGNGLQTLATLNQLDTYGDQVGQTGAPGAPPVPVGPNANTTNFPANISPNDLASISTAAELTNGQKLTFSIVSNSNAEAATAVLNGSSLDITPVAAGTTTITVRATDLDGSSTDTTVTVTVTP